MEDRTPITPSVIRAADKVEKASETSMLSGALSTHRLLDLNRASEQRQQKADGNRVVQKYREIYRYKARRDIDEQNEEDSRVVNIREAKKKRE